MVAELVIEIAEKRGIVLKSVESCKNEVLSFLGFSLLVGPRKELQKDIFPTKRLTTLATLLSRETVRKLYKLKYSNEYICFPR